MGFNPPLYKDLQIATNKLETTFHRYANSYIFPDHQLLLRYAETEIKRLYLAKIQEKKGNAYFFTPKADPLRLDQIALITQFRNDLSNDLDSQNRDLMNKAQRTLLGAILHRHLRLKSSYEEGVSGYFSSYLTNIANCALNNTLVELFNLGTLDDYTIYTCCSATWEYLQQGTTKNRYAYINKDIDFFDNFETIIEKAKLKSEAVRTQLGYIAHIDSISRSLVETDNEIVDHCFTPLKQLVAGKLAELDKEDYITREEFLACLKEINPSPRIMNIFKDLIPNHFIIKKDGNAYSPGSTKVLENDGPFLDAISKLLITQSKFVLLGAYLLCLSRCNSDSPHLSSTLRNALKISSDNALDVQTYKDALEQLEKYMDRGSLMTVNFIAWQGQEKMIRALMGLKEEYAKKPMSSEPGNVQFVLM